jgi:hypothetical protein
MNIITAIRHGKANGPTRPRLTDDIEIEPPTAIPNVPSAADWQAGYTSRVLDDAN